MIPDSKRNSLNEMSDCYMCLELEKQISSKSFQ